MAGMSLASTVSRRAAVSFAAFSMATAAYGFTSPSADAAEQIAPACVSAGSELAQLRCSTALSKKATAAYERKITASKKISDAALTSKACIDDLTRELQAAIKLGPLKPDQVKTFESRAATCQKT